MIYEWNFVIVLGALFLGISIYAGMKIIMLKSSKNALKILDGLYDKGEITRKYYMERKQTINAKE